MEQISKDSISSYIRNKKKCDKFIKTCIDTYTVAKVSSVWRSKDFIKNVVTDKQEKFNRLLNKNKEDLNKLTQRNS